MPSTKNIEYIEKTKERLKTAKAFYFTDFTGITVQNLEKLRKELKKNSASYLVLKNTLGFLALKGLGLDENEVRNLFIGPTGVAVAFDDPVIPAKILKNIEKLKIKGCFIEGSFLGASEVKRLSEIPSREVLLSSVVGSLNLLGNFVNVLESLIRNLVNALDAIKKKEAK